MLYSSPLTDDDDYDVIMSSPTDTDSQRSPWPCGVQCWSNVVNLTWHGCITNIYSILCYAIYLSWWVKSYCRVTSFIFEHLYCLLTLMTGCHSWMNILTCSFIKITSTFACENVHTCQNIDNAFALLTHVDLGFIFNRADKQQLEVIHFIWIVVL